MLSHRPPDSGFPVRPEIIALFFIVFLTVAIYGQTIRFEFVEYDDNLYVLDNARVKQGLTAEGVKWAFGSFYESTWQPFVWLSFMAEIEVFGLNPGAFHATNVFFHLACAILIFALLKEAALSLWKSAFVAVLFAVHPLHVESVAWIAERKDVASAFFFFASIFAYVRYAKRPRPFGYALVAVFFVLGLMSKPMVVTLPAVLVFLDYWPLNRLFDKGNSPIRSIALRLYEKLPLFVLSGLFCVVAVIAQKSGGSVESFASLPIAARLENACVSYAWYIWKTFWPGGLYVIYLHTLAIPVWQTVAALLMLAAVSVAVVAKARSLPALLIGWLWYLATLLPVIGIIQIGRHARADRFTYIPLVGIFIMIACAIPERYCKTKRTRAIVWTIAVVSVLLFSVSAHRQTGFWKNSFTLFERVLAHDPDNFVALGNLGSAYIRKGDIKGGIMTIRHLIALTPDSSPRKASLNYKLGKLYRSLGNPKAAIACFRETLAARPENLKILFDLVNLYKKTGDHASENEMLYRIVGLGIETDMVCYRIATAHALQNQTGEALRWLKKAIDKGFGPVREIQSDDGFRNIAGTEEFRELIRSATEEPSEKPETP